MNGKFDRDVQDITNFMNVQNAALKCEVSNKVQWQAVSQASKFRLTADVQSVLLVLERMSEDVDATAWWPSRWSDGSRTVQIKHLPLFNQTRHGVIDVTNAGAIHPLFQYAPDVIVNRITFRRFNSSFMLHNFMQKFAHFLINCWTVLRIKFFKLPHPYNAI